jgi:hypothetical protein
MFLSVLPSACTTVCTFYLCRTLRVPLATAFLVHPLQTYRLTTALVTGSLHGLPLLRPEFVARPVLVGFMVDETALGHVFLQVIPFSAVSIIRPLPHIHLSTRT